MASEAEPVFYKLAELAARLEVETSVLRFWEKEFRESVKPLMAGPRKKLYRPVDLEVFREIKRLLQEERYTIAGAKQRLARPGPPAEEASAELAALRSVLAETRRDLLDLRQFLSGGPAPDSGPPPAPGPGRPKRPKKKP